MNIMNNRRRNISDAYVYMPANDDVFVYIGKDKTKWHKLEATIAKTFREKEIAYLRIPAMIRAMRAHPVPAVHIPIPPGGENDNQREERRRRQEREDKAYNSANDRWISDQRKIQVDFGIAITILQEHVSPAINTDLEAILVAAEQRNATEEEKYNLIYNRLTSKYGPYDQKDVEHMRNVLLNMDMDKYGAIESMLLFNNTVMSMMALTPQRDGNNVIRRAEVQPVMPAVLPAAPLPQQILDHYQAVQDAIQAVAGIEGPVLNHKPTNEELKTYLKRMLQNTTITHFNNIYVESIKPQNQNWTYEDINSQVEHLIDHENDGIHVSINQQQRALAQMNINNQRTSRQYQSFQYLPDRNHYNANESYNRENITLPWKNPGIFL